MNLWVPVVKVSFRKIRLGKGQTSTKTNTIKPAQPKKRRLKLAVPLLILALVIGVIFLIVKNLTAPAEGTITSAPPSKAEISDPYAQSGHFSGKYVSFTYPAHYKKSPAPITGNYLEVVSLTGTDFSGKHVTVGIKDGSLASESGVVFRKQHPETYTQQPQTRYGIVFTSSASGSEETAYQQHDNMLATVSVTSNNSLDVSSDAQAILTSLKWN